MTWEKLEGLGNLILDGVWEEHWGRPTKFQNMLSKFFDSKDFQNYDVSHCNKRNRRKIKNVNEWIHRTGTCPLSWMSTSAQGRNTDESTSQQVTVQPLTNLLKGRPSPPSLQIPGSFAELLVLIECFSQHKTRMAVLLFKPIILQLYPGVEENSSWLSTMWHPFKYLRSALSLALAWPFHALDLSSST